MVRMIGLVPEAPGAILIEYSISVVDCSTHCEVY